MRLEDGADEDGANLLTAHVVHVKRLPAAISTLPSVERGAMHLSSDSRSGSYRGSWTKRSSSGLVMLSSVTQLRNAPKARILFSILYDAICPCLTNEVSCLIRHLPLFRWHLIANWSSWLNGCFWLAVNEAVNSLSNCCQITSKRCT